MTEKLRKLLEYVKKMNAGRVLALVLAAALTVGMGAAGLSSALKADEEQPEAPVVEQSADVTAQESAPEDTVTVVEEITVERALAEEEAPAEEAAEESLDEESAEAEPEEEATEESVEEEEPEEESEEETAEEESEEDEETEEEETPKTVRIWLDRPAVLSDGDTLTLYSEISGFEDLEITYRWQCDKGDGAGFQDVPNANGATYSFTVSAASLSWQWRLIIDY